MPLKLSDGAWSRARSGTVSEFSTPKDPAPIRSTKNPKQQGKAMNNNDNEYNPSPQEIALKRTLPDDLVQHFQAAANHCRDLLALIDQAKALEAYLDDHGLHLHARTRRGIVALYQETVLMIAMIPGWKDMQTGRAKIEFLCNADTRILSVFGSAAPVNIHLSSILNVIVKDEVFQLELLQRFPKS